MKKILFASLSFLLFACNGTEETAVEVRKNTDYHADNLKGSVQQINETSVTIDSLGVSKEDSLSRTLVYDSMGYQIESYTTDASGNKVSEQKMKRNADGSVAEWSNFKDGKQMGNFVTEMKDGKYVGGKGYDSSGTQDSYYTDLENNEYGQVTAGTEHFMDGRVKSTFSTKYDGPLYVSGSGTDSTGATNFSNAVTLDDKGNPKSETTTTTKDGTSKTEANTYTYEYDEKGNWIVQTTINEEGKPTKITKRTITYY